MISDATAVGGKSRLLLHVGPHKTGSTAIQIALKEAQARLQKAGVFFDDLAQHHGGTHRLGDLLSSAKFDEAQPIIEDIRPRDGLLILSSENLSRMNQEQARHLVEALDFDEIRVVYYLRHPLDRLNSEWRERVKHGYRNTFVEFIAGRLLRPYADVVINDRLKIDAWANVVGLENVDIQLYDRIEDASQHFFDSYCAGAGVKLDRAVRVNISFGMVKSEIYRALAGYQWHLLGERGFDSQVKALEERIAGLEDDKGTSYRRTISMSMSNPFMAQIEKRLAEDYGRAIRQPLETGRLFDKREVSWEYLAPEIWFENEDLTAELFALRRAIHARLGPPKFDMRLRGL